MTDSQTSQAAQRRRTIVLTLVVLGILILLMALFGAAAAGNFTGFESLTPSPESLAPRIVAL